MEQINKNQISLPDWSFKQQDSELMNRLRKSVSLNGQTRNIIVRKLSKDKYEVIDGKLVFLALKELPVDFIYCYVYKDVSALQAKFLYLQHDFYFRTNFVQVSNAVEEIHKEQSKLSISEKTAYDYSQVVELLDLHTYDFSKFSLEQQEQQKNLF